MTRATDSDEIEVIQRLARSMAHEMNNIFAIIVGLASVVESELDSASPLRQDVKSILEASRRGHELTRNLLGFAQDSEMRRERVAVNPLLEMTSALLRRTVPGHIELRTDFGADIGDVDGDPDQLKQALVQLTSNAVDALPTRGTLSISTAGVVLDARDLEATPRLAPGRYVRIQIADTGAGMDEEIRRQAFEPFFSTKKAAGLGLSLVRAIVERHHGRVSLFSRRGLGTTVTLDLPLAATGAVDPHLPASPARVERKVRGTVLVVDDEILVRNTVERLLIRLGYSVLLASDGEEALEIYQQRGEEISFVLLDLLMPGMDGAEVLARLKEIDPAATVLILSGFWKQEQVEEFSRRGAAGFLRKPLTLADLAERLEETLG